MNTCLLSSTIAPFHRSTRASLLTLVVAVGAVACGDDGGAEDADATGSATSSAATSGPASGPAGGGADPSASSGSSSSGTGADEGGGGTTSVTASGSGGEHAGTGGGAGGPGGAGGSGSTTGTGGGIQGAGGSGGEGDSVGSGGSVGSVGSGGSVGSVGSGGSGDGGAATTTSASATATSVAASSGATGTGGEEPCLPGTLGCACDVGSSCSGALVCRDGDCAELVCGDGIVEGSETCDDANEATGDGCHQCRFPVEIAAGRHHACARFSDGAVKCWGDATYGQLGAPFTQSIGDDPVEVGAMADIDLGPGAFATQIATGDYHSCALLSTGEIKCWGRGDAGQLGNGSPENRGDELGEMGEALPSVILGEDAARAVVSGANFVCAVTTADRIKCWGDNAFGGLGVGNTSDVGTTVASMTNLGTLPFNGITPVEVVAGRSHACLITESGKVHCWGANDRGQLGLGNEAQVGDGPGEIAGSVPIAFAAGESAVRIFTDESTSCAVLADGRTKCWGKAYNGMTLQHTEGDVGDGPGETGAIFPFVDIGVQESVLSFSASFDHTCYLTSTARVKCGGYLPYTGYKTPPFIWTAWVGESYGPPYEYDSSALPFVDLGTNAAVTQLVTGENFNCALRQDSTIVCWGANLTGQLGNGTESSVGYQGLPMGDELITVPVP